jgi:hypothetical protein
MQCVHYNRGSGLSSSSVRIFGSGNPLAVYKSFAVEMLLIGDLTDSGCQRKLVSVLAPRCSIAFMFKVAWTS